MIGSWHLAADIGSESGKIIAGRIVNGKIETAELHRFRTQDFRLNNRRARNFYRYHEEILHSLKLFADQYGSELCSIGVDAWGGDFVLLDRKGNITRLPSSYRDHAFSDVAKIVERNFGRFNLYRITGNQEMPTDTLHQILRLQQEDEPSIEAPHAILFVADVFHYLLGGEISCEHSLVSYSRIFNRERDDWDDSILDAFGIPRSIKTKISHAGECVGQVNPRILADAGIFGTVDIITPCSHDTACAALAVADAGDDWAFISSGTWSLMGTETPVSIHSEEAWRHNFSNSTMPLMTNMFKKNITGTWIIQQCKDAWKKYSYSEIVELAKNAPDLDCFVDVDAPDLYANDDMPGMICGMIGEYFGIRVDPEDAGAVARIIFQSMALKYDFYLGKLLKAAGKTISKIYIVGGGSKNYLINQFTANASGYPVYTGVFEASSVGNLLLQAYGCGELADKDAMRRVVINSFPQNCFQPEDRERWALKREIFLRDVPHRSEF